MAYTVYLYNIKTQAVYAEIPFSALSFSQVMDESGTCTVDLPLNAPKVDGTALTPDDLFPVLTGVAVGRDSGGAQPELVWGGLLWAYRVNLATRVLSITARGYLSYFEKRFTHPLGMGDRQSYDKSVLIDALIDYAANGILTVPQVVTVNSTAIARFEKYEMRALADAFSDYADDITAIDPVSGTEAGGFFLYFEPFWVSPGVIGNRMRNTANRHPYDLGVSLHQAVNCEITEYAVDGTGICNVVHAIGATDGTASMTPYASGTNTELATRLPQVTQVLSIPSEKMNRALQYKVRSALAFGANPIVQPKVVTYPGVFSPSQLIPGSEVAVTTDDGFLNLVGESYVVTETQTQIAPDGSDRHTVTLIQSELFQETE